MKVKIALAAIFAVVAITLATASAYAYITQPPITQQNGTTTGPGSAYGYFGGMRRGGMMNGDFGNTGDYYGGGCYPQYVNATDYGYGRGCYRYRSGLP